MSGKKGCHHQLLHWLTPILVTPLRNAGPKRTGVPIGVQMQSRGRGLEAKPQKLKANM